jgi:hypothetical protein
MAYHCDCDCHHYCHSCGQPFVGPNDYHVNCGEHSSTLGGNYVGPDRYEPWKTGSLDQAG